MYVVEGNCLLLVEAPQQIQRLVEGVSKWNGLSSVRKVSVYSVRLMKVSTWPWGDILI